MEHLDSGHVAGCQVLLDYYHMALDLADCRKAGHTVVEVVVRSFREVAHAGHSRDHQELTLDNYQELQARSADARILEPLAEEGDTGPGCHVAGCKEQEEAASCSCRAHRGEEGIAETGAAVHIDRVGPVAVVSHIRNMEDCSEAAGLECVGLVAEASRSLSREDCSVVAGLEVDAALEVDAVLECAGQQGEGTDLDAGCTGLVLVQNHTN